MPYVAPKNSLLSDDSQAGGVPTFSLREFNAVRKLIYREAGISMNDSKRALVSSRLAKRLAHLQLKTCSEYLDYLENHDPQGAELQVMVNCLTTNKTDFFREPHHFEFLRKVLFPRLERDALRGRPQKIRIWCAASSTGEEPYSIAISVLEHFHSLRSWDVRIFASDINTKVLQTASEGMYTLDRIKDLDPKLRKKYFLREKGQSNGLFQICPEVRRLVQFQQINLMDRYWPFRHHFDAIFCRNVIIYFNRETQQRLLPRLIDRLTNGGYLMLGHSENLYWMGDDVIGLGNTVYQRKPGCKSAAHSVHCETVQDVPCREPRPSPAVTQQPARTPAEPLRFKASKPLARPRPHKAKLHHRNIVAGEFAASRTPLIISTLLGSCVGACLYDPVVRIGGMTHFLLPCHPNQQDLSARYGINAMELLINDIMKLGGDRRRLHAKVFGGANVMQNLNWPWNIGRQNVDFIRHFLETDRIPIVSERLGGKIPLRILFLTHSGKAYVKEINARKSIAEKELNALKRITEEIKAQPTHPDITLF